MYRAMGLTAGQKILRCDRRDWRRDRRDWRRELRDWGRNPSCAAAVRGPVLTLSTPPSLVRLARR